MIRITVGLAGECPAGHMHTLRKITMSPQSLHVPRERAKEVVLFESQRVRGVDCGVQGTPSRMAVAPLTQRRAGRSGSPGSACRRPRQSAL